MCQLHPTASTALSHREKVKAGQLPCMYSSFTCILFVLLDQRLQILTSALRFQARIINITPESIRVLNASCTCNDKELAPIHFEIEYILPFDKPSVSDFEDGWYTIAQLGTEWKVDDALHADVPESPELAILPVRSSSPSTREKGKRDGSGESKGSEKSGKSDKSETPTENLGDDGLDDDAKSDDKPDRVFDSPTR
jgi:hypothetical protein